MIAEKNYLMARKNFQKIENEDFDGINLLAAAEAEMQLGQPLQAKRYWRLAATYEKSVLAANLCLIRDALQHYQSHEAITLIQSLNEKQQAQTVVLKLWAQALGQAGKWQELKDKLKEVEKTVVGRRAKRRGYSIGESMPVGDTLKVTSEENQTVSMSKEEFAGLDAALSKNDAEIIQQNWDYQQNEDRWSRLLGLLAGVGFFVFVALLLL